MDKTEIKSKFKSQSFTNFLDILNPNQPYIRSRNYNVVLKTSSNNCYKDASKYNQPTQPNQTLYITSENYHALNRNGSHKSIVRSTSTFFYDLDKIVKRHSCHYFIRKDSNNQNSKCFLEKKSNKNGLRIKTDTVVQDCAAQIQSKLKIKDNLKIKQNKTNKISLDKPRLSSEIYLNDNNININDNIYVKQEDKYLQKFWSFAKYKTEYAYPLTKEKKCKKKDHSKHIEDPCPCQLFSYACSCTDKKSLTELAKGSKVLTVIDQITSTTHFLQKTSEHNNSSNIESIKDKNNRDSVRNADEFKKKSDEIKNIQCNPSIVTNTCTKNNTNIKNRPQKKSQKLICPRCNEKLEILSTTEDECSLISKNSPLCRNSCLETETYDTNNIENNDVCNHNPPCELVPVCQILPHENECVNTKYVENVSLKHNPKMIRITKACRHHPPCTVVPSCQRINVLKNNCEFIPPCLHHPRCVNMPLCVPVFQNLYYDDIFDKQTEDKNKVGRNLSPKYKYITELQHESLNNNNVYQFHSSQNKCRCFNKCSPKLNLRPEISYTSPTSAPFHMPIKLPLKCSKSNKSCQYDYLDCKCYILDNLAETSGYNETVVYIRDVGCQFKNNNLSATNSLLYSKSSKAFYDFNTETNKFYTNFNKLCYEDKYTNPVSGEELSMSTFTSSFEIDEHCPSHGKQAYRKGSTGFSYKNPYVTAYANLTDPIFSYKLSSFSDNVKQKIYSSNNIETCSRLHTEFIKSRRSIRKQKYKNIFSVKRRRKIRSSSNSKKINVC